ncbi:aspartyl protease family protein [Adhaeretor mobilis]|uniref:Ice-binding protein C-terminal domain-containing protein n=1 Tax=Adhaeretor mobilis TaxID=1930276 RepID=A0A517MPM4_9BACT|nr:aspartyl protease family protein [Adhaeretor mobilis]QDS96829.1 hypothetical protein HG15A2_00870 [Adhaeretor mobilis]
MLLLRLRVSLLASLAICLTMPVEKCLATGVPIEGFLPQVGFALTDEFLDNFDFASIPSASPSGTMLGAGGTAHYDIALLDTGASFSLLTEQSDTDFNIDGPYPGESDGFRGTFPITLGGATGTLEASVNDPLGIYATGLQNRTASVPLVIDHAHLEGQTNVSLVTIPAESDLPNVLGLTFSSRYATHINADQPQLFTLDGRTVRTPAIDFQTLGSGGGSISRRAPLSLKPAASFSSAPVYVPDFGNPDFFDNPQENPQTPTILAAQSGALFLNANLVNDGIQLNNSELFFDSGASVSVLSELKALQLGIDVQLDTPDFSIDIVGSGGLTQDLPGYFLDSLSIQAIGGNVTATNVPVIILDITDPGNPGNIVDGIIGTNLLVGRNLVIDPNPALGGGGASPSLYISDPVTTEHNWNSNSSSASWSIGSSWTTPNAPDVLGVANVRHVAGGNQTALVDADATAWGVNISSDTTTQMTVQIQAGKTLTTFAGTNIEQGGRLDLRGGTLDTQFVEILDGMLEGNGLITTGSGPIPGQVENRNGVVSPGNGVGTLTIEGNYGNADEGTMQFDIGGPTAGTEHDQLVVDGQAKLGGTLEVELVDLGGGADPTLGEEFVLITTTEGIGGFFDTLLLPEDSDFGWLLEYGTNDLTLIATLPGDFNNDGGVNQLDLAVWQYGYGDQPNYFDGGDFLTWQRNFGSGGITSNAVPEPSSIVLLTLAGFFAIARRRQIAAS